MVSIARSIFHINTPEEILKKNLYDFRAKVNDAEFHFLIGMAMLQLGFLHEAAMAMDKAITKGGGQKSRLFFCVALLHAERYEECREEAKKIDWIKLDISQLFLYIDILKRVGEDTSGIELAFEKKVGDDLKDRIVYALYKITNGIPFDIREFDRSEFFSDADYLMFIDDCHTLGYTDLQDILFQFPVTKINVDALMSTMTGTNTLKDNPQRIDEWIGGIQIPKDENGIWSKIYATVHEATKSEKTLKKMRELYRDGAREKGAMLALAVDFLEHFDPKNAPQVKELFENLIEIDDENVLFRKKYHDFLLQCGEKTDWLDRSTMALRMRKEKEMADLIESFHRFYGNESCPLEGEGKCPLCFGSGERPVLKAICANVIPCEIFAKNYTSQTISIADEETFQKVVEWQPMHVASPIVGEYLKSKGAYRSRRDFPDILIEGETYLFVKLKSEAFERLVDCGFSIGQIEPMLSVMYPTKKPSSIERGNHEDKATDYKGFVSAKDFTIEIVRAIAKKEEKH